MFNMYVFAQVDGTSPADTNSLLHTSSATPCNPVDLYPVTFGVPDSAESLIAECPGWKIIQSCYEKDPHGLDDLAYVCPQHVYGFVIQVLTNVYALFNDGLERVSQLYPDIYFEVMGGNDIVYWRKYAQSMEDMDLDGEELAALLSCAKIWTELIIGFTIFICLQLT